MKTESDTWMVEFKDEAAPKYRENFPDEHAAIKAAENFGTTKRKRAYVYDPQGRLFGWQGDGGWHWD